ncbi:hypothetical protein AM1BK_44900 [Neobacillus kokaensis]|uniref:Uncharacterized protein n=1 Tax=Neobacillus kokaensis TaxID=2759023 RepID=A0ABQ3NA67_9BACI|nr:hypothetical protein AM1BK_44900 [Neobacillus kokaensis]
MTPFNFVRKEFGIKNATEADSGDIVDIPHQTFRKIAQHDGGKSKRDSSVPIRRQPQHTLQEIKYTSAAFPFK